MTSFPNLLKFEIRKTAILIFFLTLFWTLDYIATSTIKATISDLCSCSCSCSWACVYVYIKAILQWNMNCCACVNFMLAFVLVLLVKTRLSNLSFHPSELSRRPEKIITASNCREGWGLLEILSFLPKGQLHKYESALCIKERYLRSSENKMRKKIQACICDTKAVLYQQS